jgi:hypothetical protein
MRRSLALHRIVARRRTALVVLAIAVAVAALTGLLPAPEAQAQVGTVVPNRISIRTDQSSYPIGAPIQWCWSVPGPGEVVIVDTNAAGVPSTITQQADSGSGGCANGVVTPPSGRECLQLQWTGSGQYQTRTTCFIVQGATPPPPNNTHIWTDTNKYFVGQSVHICWTVPAPGNISVVLTGPTGAQQEIASGIDQGGQQCTNVAAGQAGSDCVSITWTFNPQFGGAGAGYTPETASTCYTVVGVYDPNQCLPPWAPQQINVNCENFIRGG